MTARTIPSRLKGLSFAISQTILISAGVTANAQAAQACNVVASPSSPTTISADVSGSICQYDSGAVTVTLNPSVTLDAGGYSYGADLESGSLTLEDNASITVSGASIVTGVRFDADGYSADTTVTLGAGSSVAASVSDEYSEGSATGIDVYSQREATITLGDGSAVSASSEAVGRNYAEGIVAESDGYAGYGAVVTINAATADISARAASNDLAPYSRSRAGGIFAESADSYAAEVAISLTDSVVSVESTSENSGANAHGIYAGSYSYGGNSDDANTTTVVTLNSTDVDVTADGANYASARGVTASSRLNNYDGNEDATVSAVVTIDDATIAVASSAGSSSANASGAVVRSYGEGEIDGSVNLSDVTLSVTAESERYTTVTGAAVTAYGEFGSDAAVTINGGTANVSAQSSSSSAYGSGRVYAEGFAAASYSEYGVSDTNITLNDADVSVVASLNLSGDNGYGGAVSYAEGLTAESYSEYDSAVATVTLNGGSLSVQASVIDGTEGSNSFAEAVAIASYADGYEGGVAVVELSGGAAVSATAAGDYADAVGIIAESTTKYNDGGSASIDIDDASLVVSASGSQGAYATGIYAEAHNVAVNIANASISVSADGGEGYGVAVGIEAVANGELDITLTNSTLSVVGSGSAPSYAEGITAGIRVRADGYEGYGAAVTLNNTSITVSDTGDGPSVGIWDVYYGKGGEAGTTVTLDINSSVDAEYAVVLTRGESRLINAGRLTGNLIINGDIDNSGTITGEVQTEVLDNSGLIVGDVFAGDIDTSGRIQGSVGGANLTVRDGGIIEGTADVETLLVESGGELQAVLTDLSNPDPTSPSFTAVDATLESGARVHINATSELYKADLEGIDYLILEADSTLTADVDELILRASGLVSVEWFDCGELKLCASVRALDLEELALLDNTSNNGVDAAGAAQSALVELAGTAKGDEFMAFAERVLEAKGWEGLDGSALGEGLLASRDADRVVSRYVQRLLQRGRSASAGEEFSGVNGLWLQALQSKGDGDQSRGVAGFEVDTAGLAMGYDAELKPGLFIGGAFSYADTTVDADDNSSRVDTDSYTATVYGQWTEGALFSSAVFSYGQGENDSRRVIVGDVAQSDYDSDYTSLRLQAGRAFANEAGWSFRPRAEFTYGKANIDSYDETGSIAALSVGSQSYESIELGAGVEVSKAFLIERSVLTPYFDLAVYHDFAADAVRTSNRFVIGGGGFVTNGTDVEETNISATLGLSYIFAENNTLKAGYEYFGNSDYDSSSWMLRYSYSF